MNTTTALRASAPVFQPQHRNNTQFLQSSDSASSLVSVASVVPISSAPRDSYRDVCLFVPPATVPLTGTAVPIVTLLPRISNSPIRLGSVLYTFKPTAFLPNASFSLGVCTQKTTTLFPHLTTTKRPNLKREKPVENYMMNIEHQRDGTRFLSSA